MQAIGKYKQLLLFIIILHLVYFFLALHFGGIYTVDSVGYQWQATNITQHGSLYSEDFSKPVRPDYYSFRPPLYALFIIAAKTVVNSDYFLLILQNLLSILTCFWVISFAESLSLNTRVVKVVSFVYLLCYPAAFIYCNTVMSDSLFYFLLWGAFYFSYRFWQTSSNRHMSLMSLFFVLCMLTKPVSLLLGIVVWIWFVAKRRMKFPVAIVPVFFIGATYSVISYTNQNETGYYHYSSVKSFFLVKYMAKYTAADQGGEAFADSLVAGIMNKADAATSYEQRLNIMDAEALAFLSGHKLAFAKLFGKGCLAFFLDPGRFDVYQLLNRNTDDFPGLYHLIYTKGILNGLNEFITNAPSVVLVYLSGCFCFNLFVFILFLRFVFSRSVKPFLKCLILLFVCYIMLSTGVLGLSRYRTAVFPQLWLMVVVVLSILSGFQKKAEQPK